MAIPKTRLSSISPLKTSIKTAPFFSKPTSLISPLKLTHSSLVRLNATATTAGTGTTSICTADELHYVPISNSDWKLALWRYLPPNNVGRRNHPLLLLSGVGTNAIGYDLSPESSFARHMSGQGYDTWILEVRGTGLSGKGIASEETNPSLKIVSHWIESTDEYRNKEVLSSLSTSTSSSCDSKVSGFTFSNRLGHKIDSPDGKQFLVRLLDSVVSGFVRRGKNSSFIERLQDLTKRLIDIIEEGQSMNGMQEGFSRKLRDFQEQLDIIAKYDWDFDHYLEEDVPTAMEYIRTYCKSKDGKLLGIGHSMGGILLYAMLSRCGYEQRDSGLAAIATLGSSLDYTSSKSSLKLLLPLVDPAQVLNVPVIPLGALLAAAHPLASRPPYIMSWLSSQISAEDMMHPDLLEKLVLNNFCTVPAKLLLQLTTAFREGGLCDRSGNFFYKDHLSRSNVPILAIAGDQDLICPPLAVYETAKLVPGNLLTYKVFGEPSGPHYAHYDLVGGRRAADQVYPCIISFLNYHDKI